MLDRLMDSLKLVAWFAVASACLIATILAHRAPQSLLGHQASSGPRATLNCSYSEPDLEPMPIATSDQQAGDCGCDSGFCSVPAPLTAQPIAAVGLVDDREFQPTSALVVELPLPNSVPMVTEQVDSSSHPACPARLADDDGCGEGSNEWCSESTCEHTQLAQQIVEEIAACQAATSQIETSQTEPHAHITTPSVCVTQKPHLSKSVAKSSTQALASAVQDATSGPIVNETKITMRDLKTNHAVATLKLGGRIAATAIDEEELRVAAAERKRQRLQARRKRRVPTGQVVVYKDEESGNIVIDADTVEISDLASKLAGQFHQHVTCHESAYGTVSARVSDVTFLRTLRRLVEPFGLAVMDLGDQLVIGEVVALENAERRAALLREQEEALQAQMAAAAAEQPAQLEPMPAGQPVADAAPPADPPKTVQANHMVQAKAAPHEIEVGKVARSLIAAGKLNATKDLLQDAIHDHPTSAIFFRMLGEVHWHQQQFEPARVAIEQSLKLDKHNPLTNQLYGEILTHFGQSTRAQHYIQQAQHLRSLNQ